MRRLVPLVVPTALVFALAACGGDDAGGALSTDEWCERAENINSLSDDLDAVDPLDPEGIEAASESVRSYNVRECGFDPRDPDVDDDAFDFGAGSARDQLVEEFVASGFIEAEARCIADNITIETLGTDDEVAIFEVFDTCDIGLGRLGRLGELGG